MLLILIIIVAILCYIVDVTTYKNRYKKSKNKINTHMVILIHHIIVVFSQFGWLSNDKRVLSIYLCAPLLIMFHWKTNSNKCLMTEYVNKQCELPEGTYFNNIWFLLEVEKKIHLFISILILRLWIVLILWKNFNKYMKKKLIFF